MGRHTLELYDAIDEMPIGRFHRFNRCLMVDAGIGGDIAAVDAHLAKAIGFMKTEKTDLAVRELENMRQGIWLIQQGIDPKFSAFASLIASVDGRSTEGMSESELDGLLEELKDVPFKVLSSELGRMLSMMAPRQFDGSNGAEVQYDREFETMCLAMTQQLHVNVKDMTVMEYYNAYEYLREQSKKMNAARHRR